MVAVTLYGTRFCSFCSAAKQLLTSKGIIFDDISLDSDLELRIEIMEKSGQRTVPQIWIGKIHVGGFSELRDLEVSGKLDALLSS